MQLTPQEAAEYKGIPVVYHGDIGFFFEPNEHGVIKVCDEFPGFTQYKQHQPYGADKPKPVSVPRSHAKHPTDTYPNASETTIRKAIGTYLPRFTQKELFNRSMCWCTDTADSSLLICEHPRWKNFILATGDSGLVLLQPAAWDLSLLLTPHLDTPSNYCPTSASTLWSSSRGPWQTISLMRGAGDPVPATRESQRVRRRPRI